MLLTIIAIILMLIGLAGVLVPFLPGVPVVWLGFWLFAYQSHWEKISLQITLIFLALTVLSVILEFALPLMGAKKYRASKQGLIGAALGLLIGPFVGGPFGLIIGPLLGAIIGEFVAGKKQDQALQSGLGTFVGFMVSILLRLVLVFVMIGFFAIAILR